MATKSGTKRLGRIVRDIRRMAKMTQAQLARYIPATIRSISRWESGASAPREAQRLRLALLAGEFERFDLQARIAPGFPSHDATAAFYADIPKVAQAISENLEIILDDGTLLKDCHAMTEAMASIALGLYRLHLRGGASVTSVSQLAAFLDRRELSSEFDPVELEHQFRQKGLSKWQNVQTMKEVSSSGQMAAGARRSVSKKTEGKSKSADTRGHKKKLVKSSPR